MPNSTEAPLNTLRQATPELEIHGPKSNELPATWLTGETITLRATGGNGRYQWLTTAPEAVTIKHQQDDRCEVAIEGTAAAQILAFSAEEAAIYKGLAGNRPLLKAVDNIRRNYPEAEQYCQQLGGSLPTQKTIEDIVAARKTEFLAWARNSFPVTLGSSTILWLKNEKDQTNPDCLSSNLKSSDWPLINLEPEVYADLIEAVQTKTNEFATQQNSIQALKDKERQLLEKGANLPADAIRKNAEDTAIKLAIENGDFSYNTKPEGGMSINPNDKGNAFIKEQVDAAVTAHREKQIALSDIQEKLHTAEGDLKTQLKELLVLNKQQVSYKTTVYTLCQFNPATLDQAVASWVSDAGEATPGDQFTTGQYFSQRSAASAQLSQCQGNL